MLSILRPSRSGGILGGGRYLMWCNLNRASNVLVLPLPALAAGQEPNGFHPETRPGRNERLASIAKAQEEARLRYRREKETAKNEDEVEKALDRYCEAGSKNAEAALDLV